MEIPLYQDGNWRTCPHPFPDGEGDYEELLKAAGYTRATQLDAGGDERSVSLVVWDGHQAASGAPKYLVDVEFNPAGSIETVAAAGIVDVMNLLATWSPVVQAAYVCDEASAQFVKAEAQFPGR